MFRKTINIPVEYIIQMMIVFSLGRDTKQSTTFLHGYRAHLKISGIQNLYTYVWYWTHMNTISEVRRIRTWPTYARSNLLGCSASGFVAITLPSSSFFSSSFFFCLATLSFFPCVSSKLLPSFSSLV